MELGKVYTADVVVGERLRRLDGAKVMALAESMKAIGLQTPLHIWMDGEKPHLVAGRNRLAAAVHLGWDEIDCVFVDFDEIDRQIWEIDENLARAELSPAEIALHTAKRKELWEKRTKVPHVAAVSGGRGRKGFAQETADATGLSKDTVQRAAARGEHIASDVLQAVVGTPLDTGTKLDALAKMPAKEQRRAASLQSLPKQDDADARQLGRLKSAWRGASESARSAFIDWLEEQGVKVFGLGNP